MLGATAGLAPHLVHHVALLAGTAVLAGAGGTVLFGLVGLAAMAPMLIRLRRRSGGWRAPGLAVLVFAAMFAASTLVIGPAVRSAIDDRPAPAPSHTHTHG